MSTIAWSGEWWEAVGHSEEFHALARKEGRDPEAPFDPTILFLHDVSPDTLEWLMQASTPA